MKIQLESSKLVIFESALFRTTTSLIIANDHLIVVDPNWFPVELKFMQDYIAGLPNKKAKYLFFTHSDYDHIIGYNFFKEYKTIASRNFVNQKKKESILDKIQTIDDDNYTLRKYPVEYPQIDIVIEENQSELTIGSVNYQVGYLLGHNDDSIYLLNSMDKVLIVGDYLSNIEFPYVYHSFTSYLKSLDILSTLISTGRVETLIPGHGDYTTDQKEMKKRVNESLAYIDKLKIHFENKSKFDFEAFVKQYDFPQVMRKFHNANLELLAKEFGGA